MQTLLSTICNDTELAEVELKVSGQAHRKRQKLPSQGVEGEIYGYAAVLTDMMHTTWSYAELTIYRHASRLGVSLA